MKEAGRIKTEREKIMTFTKYDFLMLGGIIFVTIIIMTYCLRGDVIYGSKDDWASQHYAIPEYFRTLFYSTHNFFPSYAPNIGAGENIYALSYYGLYSPIIVLSYFLPFVPMSYYIIATSVLSVFFSEGLLYYFFRRKYSTSITAFVTLLFAISTPFIVNTHRQIMFIGYMPFLLLSMISLDGFFNRGKKFLFILFTFLTIMCNYFFAVSALVALSCYGLFFLLSEREFNIKIIAKRYGLFIGAITISVMMSAFLILPTAYVLVSGRSGDAGAKLLDLVPSIRFDRLTYFGYTMGLSALGILASIYSLFRGKRNTRFIAILVMIMATCPIVIYLLNGTLYVDPKVLFAFLPLALIPVADFLELLFSSEAECTWKIITVFLASSVISTICAKFSIFANFYLADVAIVLLGTLLVIKAKKKFFSALFFIIPFVTCMLGNNYDQLQPIESFQNVNSPTVASLVSEVSDGMFVRTAIDTTRLYTVNKVYSPNHYTDTIYSSVHSQDYNNFYLEEMYNENEYRNSALTTRSRNILFNCRMGNKYYISRKKRNDYGLKLIKSTEDGYYLYENQNAFPIIWTGLPVMSLRQYNSLDYPENIEALMSYTIVPEEVPDVDFSSSLTKIDIGNIFDLSNTNYETIEDNHIKYVYELPEDAQGKILLLRFDVNNKEKKNYNSWERGGDIRIRINGVKNTLTQPNWKYHNGNSSFEYVISNLKDKLTINITGNEYEISGLTVYTLEPEFLDNLTNGLESFEADMSETGGDFISGTITAEEDGYVDTSLVWHDGFTILVDGKEVEPIKTDTAFLGFPIKKGTHKIEIHFEAPLSKVGKIISLIGLLVFIIVLFRKEKNLCII